MKRTILTTAAALLLVPAVPSAATTSDGCTIGSPNIIRDVTDCVQHVLENCPIGGSPNIIRDLQECLR